MKTRLVVLAALAAVVAVGVAQTAKEPQTVAGSLRNVVVTPSTLSLLGTLAPDGVREFVVTVDGLLDTLERPAISPNDYDIVMWAYEVLPYFEYERVRNGVVIPNSAALTAYLTGMEHQHILGRATCVAPNDMPFEGADRPYPFDVELNGRLGNQHSAWYGDPSYLPTLIHEFAHVQGACGHGEADEHAAQVVTAEILSALVLGGNREALYPLLEELRSWALGWLLYDAINLNDGSEEKLAAYKAFRDGVYDDPFETARSDKALRFWDREGRSNLSTMLHTYSVTPFVKLVEGFGSGSVPLVIPNFEVYERGWEDKPYPGHRKFVVDDFVAFLQSVEALVAQAATEEPPGS